jgi:hypothetical protein
VKLMNAIKAHGAAFEVLIQDLRRNDADLRWTAIGATHIQQGLMALTRAVAKPDFF